MEMSYAVTLVLAALPIYYIFLTLISKKKGIPCPPRTPVLGHVLDSMPISEIPIKLEKWAFEYGSIYQIDLMGSPTIVISDLEAINEILRKRPQKFGRDSGTLAAFASFKIDGIFSFEG